MPASRVVRLAVLPLLLALSAAAPAVAEDDDKKPPRRGPEEFPGLSYRLVGPPAGGRVSRVAGVPGNPLIGYAATASGGVWKSTDGGIRWTSVFDQQPVSSIGSIAVAPSDPNVVYVGSGEANFRGNAAEGNGIYKSTDAGRTWTHVWKQRGQIGTMVVHPKDPDVAFAAVLGRPFGANPERGVYRTTDGGQTWERVLDKDAGHRGLRRRTRPREPAERLRRVLADAPPALGAGERRAREAGSPCRATAATRGRGSPATACPRGSGARSGVAVAPVRSPTRVRPHRGAGGRPLPLRRRRRDAGRARATTGPSARGPGTTRR